MDSIAIIAEYNPFHKGHAYQIQEIKQRHPEATIVIIMSGSFTQRGIPAMFSKFDRAQWALAAGADLVIELPSLFAMASAEYFGAGAIRQIASLGINHCVFGAKNAQIGELTSIAELLDSDGFERDMKIYLQEGLSYATARQQALMDLAPHLAPLLEDANNLLGIAYIRAAKKYHLDITFETVDRHDHHHSETPIHSFASGSYLRKELASSLSLSNEYFTTKIAPYLFADSTDSLYECLQLGNYSDIERYEDALLLTVKKASKQELEHTLTCSEGLESRLYQAREASTFSEFLEKVKTKRYTYSRLWRLCANLLLGRTQENAVALYEKGPLYHHVLGFTEKGQAFMKEYKGELPMVTKWGAFYRQAGAEPTSSLYEMAKMDVLATDMQAFTMASPDFRQGAKDSRFSPKPFISQ